MWTIKFQTIVLNVSNHYDDIVAVNAVHFHYDNSIISEKPKYRPISLLGKSSFLDLVPKLNQLFLDPPFHKTSAKILGDTGWKNKELQIHANMVSNCIVWDNLFLERKHFFSSAGLSTFYSELMRGLGASTRLWELLDRQPLIPFSGKPDFPKLYLHSEINSILEDINKYRLEID